MLPHANSHVKQPATAENHPGPRAGTGVFAEASGAAEKTLRATSMPHLMDICIVMGFIYASPIAICSLRISLTVSATMTLPVLLKNAPISVKASALKSKDTKNPFVQSSRIITV